MGSPAKLGSICFLVAAGLGCATTGPARWPGPPPHLVTFVVAGPEADKDKQLRCEQIARDAGATIAPTAPVIATLNLADGNNRLVVTTKSRRTLLDQSQPAWPTGRLCAEAIHKVADVYPEGSVQDFVSEYIGRDPALGALLAGVAQAQTAFNMAAETPIDELEEGSDRYQELVKTIGAAQDAYRRYASYGRSGSAVLDTGGKKLLDLEPDELVRVQGSGAAVRVDTKPDRITLLAVESDRGRTILTFDRDMKAIVSPEFRPYLVGDRVDVSGVVKRRVRRDQGAIKPDAAPGGAGGCVKDTDCKGDRVCEQGACVSPPAHRPGR